MPRIKPTYERTEEKGEWPSSCRACIVHRLIWTAGDQGVVASVVFADAPPVPVRRPGSAGPATPLPPLASTEADAGDDVQSLVRHLELLNTKVDAVIYLGDIVLLFGQWAAPWPPGLRVVNRTGEKEAVEALVVLRSRLPHDPVSEAARAQHAAEQWLRYRDLRMSTRLAQCMEAGPARQRVVDHISNELGSSLPSHGVLKREYISKDAFLAPYTDPNMSLRWLDRLAESFFAGDLQAHRHAAIVHRLLTELFPTTIGLRPSEITAVIDEETYGGLTPSLLRNLMRIEWRVDHGFLVRQSMAAQFDAVAAFFRRLSDQPFVLPRRYEEHGMAEDQVQAARGNLSSCRCTFLLGPAGTGKTHLLRSIAAVARVAGYMVVGLGFMGSVVQNLRNQMPEIETSTVHSFSYREKSIRGNRLCLLLDEVFTVGMELAHLLITLKLVNFIDSGGDLWFVMSGDPYQLEPVKDYPIFTALLGHATGLRTTHALPWVHSETLHINKRQGPMSEIAHICAGIRRGIPPPLGGRVIRKSSMQEMLNLVRSFQGDIVDFPSSFLVLSGTNGDLNTMTKVIRGFVNPTAREVVMNQIEVKGKLTSVATNLRVGDIVVCGANFRVDLDCVRLGSWGKDRVDETQRRLSEHTYYTVGAFDIYNGTLGTIVRDGQRLTLLVQDSYFPLSDLPAAKNECGHVSKIPIAALYPAYARSVYRSQGLEADVVLLYGSGRFSRRLVYTAFSRARRNIYFCDAYGDYVNAATRMIMEPTEAYALYLLESH